MLNNFFTMNFRNWSVGSNLNNSIVLIPNVDKRRCHATICFEVRTSEVDDCSTQFSLLSFNQRRALSTRKTLREAE